MLNKEKVRSGSVYESNLYFVRCTLYLEYKTSFHMKKSTNLTFKTPKIHDNKFCIVLTIRFRRIHLDAAAKIQHFRYDQLCKLKISKFTCYLKNDCSRAVFYTYKEFLNLLKCPSAFLHNTHVHIKRGIVKVC